MATGYGHDRTHNGNGKAPTLPNVGILDNATAERFDYMRLVNSRGRVLLQVVGASRQGINGRTIYVYRGDGCGGHVNLETLHQTAAAITTDSPSAHWVGYLPEPEILPAVSE